MIADSESKVRPDATGTEQTQKQICGHGAEAASTAIAICSDRQISD